MVCLDTSFLIDLFRGRKDATRKMLEIEGTSESVTIAAPTIMEFATGLALMRSSKEREYLNEFLDSASVLPLDKTSALLAGEVNASLIKAGKKIGELDILIGAIALTHGERLLTRNTKHFSRIRGLITEDYTKE